MFPQAKEFPENYPKLGEALRIFFRYLFPRPKKFKDIVWRGAKLLACPGRPHTSGSPDHDRTQSSRFFD